MPTCSRVGYGPWPSTASSTRSQPPPGPRPCWPAMARFPGVKRLLARLRHTPIPAPSATPPGEVTYGEALTALKDEGLHKPEQWPLAANLLEAAVQGDGSGIKPIAAGATSDQVRMLLQEQG